MLRILHVQRPLLSLCLASCLLAGCETDILFEPKYSVATCNDGIKNQGELEVDCGTESCGPCVAQFEEAPCAEELQQNTFILNSNSYSLDDKYVYTNHETNEMHYELTLYSSDEGYGKLSLRLSDFSTIKKSSTFTLKASEANPAEAPYYHLAEMEFTSYYSGYPSKASQGYLYVEVQETQRIISFCDIVLNNSVNFGNTVIITGQFVTSYY